jgi:diguanylate cyclase (GGDEF)-like protein
MTAGAHGETDLEFANMGRGATTNTRLAGLAEAVVRTLSAAAGLLHDGVPASVALPRMGASIRRLLSANPSGDLQWRPKTVVAPAIRFDSVAEVASENARLHDELQELQAKYMRLAAEAAERTAESERFHHLSLHDALTNLPNRHLLMDRLADALAQAQRAGTEVLVIFLDLNHFKAINDTLGHAAGDRVLSEVALRIAGCLRRADTASRVGGDEFILVRATTDAAGEVADIRTRLTRAIAAPIDIHGTPVTIGASLGFSSFPADGCRPAELIDKADRAMYRLKRTLVGPPAE